MAATKEISIPVRVRFKGFWAKSLLLANRADISIQGHKQGFVTTFQFVCFIAGLVGIALMPIGAWAVPAAIIIGAFIGITAAERQ